MVMGHGMVKKSAEEFYQDVSDLEVKTTFTKLTKTGISSDYDNVFEFAEAYHEDRLIDLLPVFAEKILKLHNVVSINTLSKEFIKSVI